ncbi:MAG: 3-isopropylmalate dehydrogenase [Acidobacteria bacterium]|nr:3-isopropylmalate dehydrogenase [Acidobacteriota bacterium]
MRLRVLALPGDGVGPEVTAQALAVLERVAAVFGHELEAERRAIGGEAIATTGVPLPEDTARAAEEAPATLLGAVGLPAYDHLPPEGRPERGLLDLRQRLGVFANLRPSRTWPSLLDASPLKAAVVDGTDLVFVRELTSGLYYGTPRGVSGAGPGERGVNTMTYSRAEIERVARVAFELARARRRRVTSVDKSNVLETSQLWRRVVSEVGRDYADVALGHMYVDNCAMQVVLDPRQFDVVLTENLFGDILSDEAAVLAGSIGMLASASVGTQTGATPDGRPVRRGLYEPVHGSAPDLAGQGRANPLGAIGSAAMLLEYSFGLRREAAAVSRAIDAVVASGRVTADLRPPGPPATTAAVGRAVCDAIADD